MSVSGQDNLICMLLRGQWTSLETKADVLHSVPPPSYPMSQSHLPIETVRSKVQGRVGDFIEDISGNVFLLLGNGADQHTQSEGRLQQEG